MRTMNQISIDTYLQHVKPELTKREQWVYDAIEYLGEGCAYTVANHLEVPINMVSGRFTGLKKKGKIVPTKLRDVGTGRMAMFFRVVKEVETEYVDSY